MAKMTTFKEMQQRQQKRLRTAYIVIGVLIALAILSRLIKLFS